MIVLVEGSLDILLFHCCVILPSSSLHFTLASVLLLHVLHIHLFQEDEHNCLHLVFLTHTQNWTRIESYYSQDRNVYTLKKLCVGAERAWPGVSCTYRTVAAEEKQSPEWEKRAAGGAGGAHPRGGTQWQCVHVCLDMWSIKYHSVVFGKCLYVYEYIRQFIETLKQHCAV